jgi:RNA polymerase sigma-70 factor (ECF subfamily)
MRDGQAASVEAGADGDASEGGAPAAPVSMPRIVLRPAIPTDAADLDPPGDRDDERAVSALLRGGNARAAIAHCARVHGAAIGRLAYALLGSQADADETTQETLLAAYDAAANFRGEGTVRAWLFGIARRTCARRLEVRSRQARRRELVAAVAEQSRGLDTLDDDARRGGQVRAALESLKPTEREAVLLRYESELSFRDVALACGIDEAAARKRVGRALERLRTRLA